MRYVLGWSCMKEVVHSEVWYRRFVENQKPCFVGDNLALRLPASFCFARGGGAGGGGEKDKGSLPRRSHNTESAV